MRTAVSEVATDGRAAALLLVALAGACTGAQPSERADPPPEPSDPIWFEEYTAELGLPESPPPWPAGRHATPEILGPGVAIFDADGDGDLDLLQLSVPPPDRPHAEAPNRLWRQEPNGGFVEIPAGGGLADPGFAQGVAVGDADGDGRPDVYLANHGPDSFYRNRGDGTFENATATAGFSGDSWSSAAAFCDHDLDGDLDLYVVHYLRDNPNKRCTGPSGARDYCSPAAFPGVGDALWINDGSGRFRESARAAGISGLGRDPYAKGLGVACFDLTDDGRPDYYVANDRESNQLWVNQGDGTFVDEALLRGLAVNAMGTPEASMGIAVGDATGDGRSDLLLTHFAGESNTLYVSGAGGRWSDGTYRARLGRADLPFTGFGCVLADFDLDGDADLAVVNGRVLAGAPDPRAAGTDFWRSYAEPNLLFRNDGGVFERADELASDFTGRVEVTRGLAAGDLDGDGDLDLVSSRMDGSLRVFRNRAEGSGRAWLRVRARDRSAVALGAEVRLRQGERWLVSPILSSVSYQSASEPVASFGLGSQGVIDELIVRWADGAVESFPVPRPNREIVLQRGEGSQR